MNRINEKLKKLNWMQSGKFSGDRVLREVALGPCDASTLMRQEGTSVGIQYGLFDDGCVPQDLEEAV